VYVYLNDDRTETEHDVQVESSALIFEMRERIASLERQLNEANDRDRENRRIIAGLTQRIPELPAPNPQSSPTEMPGAPESATERTGGGYDDASPPKQGSTKPRSLWRRIFGV
jgi:hypothetical protein